MCDCLKTITNKLREELRKQVEEKTTVAEWKDEGTFEGSALMFGEKAETRLSLPFTAEYYIKKKNGYAAGSITRKRMNVLPSYCPFCGVKFENK